MDDHPKANKTPFNTRLSEDAQRLLKLIAEKKGTTMTAVLEEEIRRTARRERIK